MVIYPSVHTCVDTGMTAPKSRTINNEEWLSAPHQIRDPVAPKTGLLCHSWMDPKIPNHVAQSTTPHSFCCQYSLFTSIYSERTIILHCTKHGQRRWQNPFRDSPRRASRLRETWGCWHCGAYCRQERYASWILSSSSSLSTSSDMIELLSVPSRYLRGSRSFHSGLQQISLAFLHYSPRRVEGNDWDWIV